MQSRFALDFLAHKIYPGNKRYKVTILMTNTKLTLENFPGEPVRRLSLHVVKQFCFD